jgi:glycosyltransferase involved in cell wall biosynthesis
LPGARVVFVNRYFHPDHSATSQMVSDLAFHLAASGFDVEVITSRQRYDDPSAQLPAREVVNKVTITRVATTRFGRAFLAARAIDYLTFYVSAWVALLRRRDAVVVAMTDPPLMSIVAMLASRRRVNWIQDLFPEVAEALGVLRGSRLLRSIRDVSLRGARANVVIGDAMARRVDGHVIVQHNWADANLRPLPRTAGAPFSVGYSGNLGRAHDFETITGAMRLLARDDIHFVITGGGAQLDSVKHAVHDLGHVEFRPYQPRELLSESLSAADVHLVSLQPQLEGLIVPSKIYGILAVARPAIFIGAADGEIGNMLTKNDCGMVVRPGDAQGLADAIRALAADRERAAAMGLRGRALYERAYAPSIAFAHWERILEDATHA